MTLEEREQKWMLWLAAVAVIAGLLMWVLGLIFTQMLFGPYL
jgi:short subunit fatty acids transporter